MAKRFTLALVALLVSACGGGKSTYAQRQEVAASRSPAQAPPVAVIGRLAPAWAGPALNGGSVSDASLRGRPVYLNFFASWCGPCNDEAAGIEALSKRFASSGLTVVGVDESETAAKAQGFASAHGLTYKIVVDDGSMRDPYGVNGLPEHVFIGRSGVVRDLVLGQMSPDEIEKQLHAIVAQGS